MASPWQDWLNENWQAAFGAYRPQTGSYNYLNWLKGQQGNVYDQYMAQMGRMARADQVPNLSQTQYLSSYPFLSAYLGMTPSQRGERSPGYAIWNIWRG